MSDPNERLRKAMVKSRLTIEELATKIGVTSKSVHRWLNGQTPYARHRWLVAKALNEDEHYLWPESDSSLAPGVASTAEVVEAFPHRADVPIDRWWNRFTAADHKIDLLGYAMLFLPESHPRLLDLLKGKAAMGCRLRIAFGDPQSPQVQERDAEEGLNGNLGARIRTAVQYFQELGSRDGVELRYFAAPLYNSVFRFDEDMFVTPHLYGQAGYRSPLLHLRRLGSGGIFDSFAGHFEDLWNSSRTIQGISSNDTH